MSMEVRVQLVHADGQVRVVLVSAYAGERLLGSALGEAPDAEAAEDRALGRLLARLAAGPPQGAAADPAVATTPVAAYEASAAATAPLAPPRRRLVAGTTLEPSGQRNAKAAQPPQTAAATPTAAPIPSPIPAEDPSPPPPDPITAEGPSPPPTIAIPAAAPPPQTSPETGAEPPADPEDWSSELLHLDRELKRLNWGRPEEEVYLQRAFGHPSRNRLTSYADLLAYLRAVEALSAPTDPAAAAVPMRRQELLSQCDALLRQLGWPTERARQFLETQLQVSSRQQLSDQDLLQFNLILEGELLAAG